MTETAPQIAYKTSSGHSGPDRNASGEGVTKTGVRRVI